MEQSQTGGLAVTLLWGDGDHTFRLPVGAWRKIEAKCQAGPEEIVARLAPSVKAFENSLGLAAAINVGLVGRLRVDDVRETLLQGLLYGEPQLGPVAAARLITDFVDERPLRENCTVAFAVAMASLQGLTSLTETKLPQQVGRTKKTSSSRTIKPRGVTSTGAADERA